ncbi:MAG TPA: class I SAM-dependent methyltransferase [Gaiellaceae bacterium]|nr:class I SAM-dependent methyltransferase [Gaiellaceae bacterium]
MLRAFIRSNQRVSSSIMQRAPHRRNLWNEYVDVVADALTKPEYRVVVDIGGGRSCPFARTRPAGSRAKIIAADVSQEELAYNSDVDECVVADASQTLPFSDGEVDLLTSSSTVEHLPDVEAFIRESHRVLRPGGAFVHVFPSKFALYAVLNRCLPNSVAKRALKIVFPGSDGVLGFEAHYDRCYASGIKKALERNGFEIVEIRTSYFSAYYFSFFVPLFLLATAFELATYYLRLKNLGAGLLVIARRGQDSAADLSPQEPALRGAA